jgi:hypothetical protein
MSISLSRGACAANFSPSGKGTIRALPTIPIQRPAKPYSGSEWCSRSLTPPDGFPDMAVSGDLGPCKSRHPAVELIAQRPVNHRKIVKLWRNPRIIRLYVRNIDA